LRQSKLEQELKLCYAYQGALIPSAPPRLNGYRVRDWLDVGSPLAGDYYDYIPLADGRLAVFLADVAGKGIEAVMAVARLSAQVHYWLPQPVGPAEVMTRINDDVCERGDRFIAALLVVLRPDSHTVAVVNAGHTPPIWRQSKSAIETPGRTLSGLPLGVQAGQVYQSEEIILAPGDLLLLSTDGLAQTLNGREERFTFERLLDCVRQEPSGLDEVIYRISRAVREHQGGAKRGDDQCVVGLQRE
jgi:serine phosphatase RsbU (regulator of sigma subunit)